MSIGLHKYQETNNLFLFFNENMLSDSIIKYNEIELK